MCVVEQCWRLGIIVCGRISDKCMACIQERLSYLVPCAKYHGIDVNFGLIHEDYRVLCEMRYHRLSYYIWWEGINKSIMTRSDRYKALQNQ